MDRERRKMLIGEINSLFKLHKVHLLEAHDIAAELMMDLAVCSYFTSEDFREVMMSLCDDYESEVNADE